MKDIKSEWDKLISAKLKSDVKIDDLQFDYGSGIKMPPNIINHNNDPIIYSKDKKTWVNMASIEGSNVGDFNNLIHIALNQGANGLDLRINENLNVKKILDGVLLEYLDVRIVCSNKVNVESVKNSLDNSEYKNIRWVGHSSDIQQIFLTGSNLEQIKSFLSTIEDSNYYDIIVSIGKNIFFEISLLRALRQELSSKGISNFNILANFKIEGNNHLGDYDLIEQSFKVMSAIMGNADIVLTNFTGDERSRLSLNIHNILELESNFKSVINPIQGSYYIEKLTEKIRAKLK